MGVEQIFSPRMKFDSPYMGDYFGLWMVHEEQFRAMVQQVNGTNLHLHMQSAEIKSQVSSRDRREYEVDANGIAIFEIDGPMMKSVPSMGEGVSYLRLRQQISSARRDPEVLGGLLLMDTPGGTVRGNEDLVKEVAKFAQAKPLISFTEDMTASAGVSIASQATKRYANNATAIYGSMGTFAVLQDMSGMAEKLGITVHVIRAGEYKGMGTPGTEITEQQLTEMQRIVNTMNENYLGLIAGGLGRSVESIRPLADGRVIMASDAVSAGLIHGIQSLEQTKFELAEMVSAKTSVSMPTQRSEQPMAEKNPATLKELKQTFPNSSAEWRESQMEAGSDLSQAAIAYAAHVEAKAAAAAEEHQKELEAAKSQKTVTAPSSSIGHTPLTAQSIGDDIVETGDAVADFEEHVSNYMVRNRCSRQDSINAIKRKNPELTKQYLLATNKSLYGQRTLRERFDSLKV